MKTCENCGDEHNGKYGSGRFCSTKCSRGFSTKAKRKEINEKVSKTMLSYSTGLISISCMHCDISFTVPHKSVRKFCSQSCATTYRNLGSTKSNKVKQKIKESVRKAYENGKKVYGGKTKWHTYKGIKVQGSYELRTCKILDRWKDEKRIKDWEYTNDRIQYSYNGENSSYLLDFKIFENDGSFYYLETKGYQTERDIAKWKQLKNMGLSLVIWFDEDIKKYE